MESVYGGEQTEAICLLKRTDLCVGECVTDVARRHVSEPDLLAAELIGILIQVY